MFAKRAKHSVWKEFRLGLEYISKFDIRVIRIFQNLVFGSSGLQGLELRFKLRV